MKFIWKRAFSLIHHPLASLMGLFLFFFLGVSIFLIVSTQKGFTQTVPQKHFANTLFIGDSLTRGYFATTASNDFVNQLLTLLHNRDSQSGLTVSSSAVYGFTTAQMISSLNSSSTPANQDLVVVEMGTNDYSNSVTLSQFRQNYTQLVSEVMASNPNATLVCLGIWQSPTTSNGLTGGGTGEDYSNVVKSVCNTYSNSVYVDITPLFNNTSDKGPAGISTFSGTSDNFHPNDAGHAAIANLIFSSLSVYMAAPTPPISTSVAGYFRSQSNTANCAGLSGWSCQDSTTLNQQAVSPNRVDLYGNATYGQPGSVFMGSTYANTDVGSPDLGLITYKSSICGNTTKRYFSFPVPASLRDGTAHTIYAYSIDINSARNSNQLFANGPVSVTCTDYTPKGYYNLPGDCTSFKGWACQYPGLYNRVDFYDGSGFSHYLGSTTANINTGDNGLLNVAQCGSMDHYFSFPLPSSIKDGTAHTIYAYVIDDKTSRNYNPSVGNGPMTLTCN